MYKTNKTKIFLYHAAFSLGSDWTYSHSFAGRYILLQVVHNPQI